MSTLRENQETLDKKEENKFRWKSWMTYGVICLVILVVGILVLKKFRNVTGIGGLGDFERPGSKLYGPILTEPKALPPVKKDAISSKRNDIVFFDRKAGDAMIRRNMSIFDEINKKSGLESIQIAAMMGQLQALWPTIFTDAIVERYYKVLALSSSNVSIALQELLRTNRELKLTASTSLKDFKACPKRHTDYQVSNFSDTSRFQTITNTEAETKANGALGLGFQAKAFFSQTKNEFGWNNVQSSKVIPMIHCDEEIPSVAAIEALDALSVSAYSNALQVYVGTLKLLPKVKDYFGITSQIEDLMTQQYFELLKNTKSEPTTSSNPESNGNS